jgi:hypothetical protein
MKTKAKGSPEAAVISMTSSEEYQKVYLAYTDFHLHYGM